MAGKRKCVVCGALYDYCPNCNTVEPSWKFLFDSENCEKLWEQFNAYRTGQQNAFQTQKELRSLDLSKEENFDQVWKDLLAKIRSEAKPAEVKRDEEPNNNNKRYFKQNKYNK